VLAVVKQQQRPLTHQVLITRRATASAVVSPIASSPMAAATAGAS
jgi:hypothetical protein